MTVAPAGNWPSSPNAWGEAWSAHTAGLIAFRCVLADNPSMIAANFVAGLVVLAIILGLYFLPAIVAFNRDVANKGSVLVINLFLGWTLIGWVVALAMAARSVAPKPPAPWEQHKPQPPPPPPGGMWPPAPGRQQPPDQP